MGNKSGIEYLPGLDYDNHSPVYRKYVITNLSQNESSCSQLNLHYQRKAFISGVTVSDSEFFLLLFFSKRCCHC